MTKYICVEGGEGTYKTTTVSALVKHYRSIGLKVLETKEPGTLHLPVTLELRKIMLSNEYNHQITPEARELLTQAIRSIHLDKLIKPELKKGDYDLIIQDRGLLSGRIYAKACGNSPPIITVLENYILDSFLNYLRRVYVYDSVIVFYNDMDHNLEVASSAKQEFVSGDAIESMGPEFHTKVNREFKKSMEKRYFDFTYKSISGINVTNKTTGQLVDLCVELI